jgi:hypothetical protein
MDALIGHWLMRPRLFARERLRWRAIALCVVGYCLVLVAWSAPGPSPEDAPQPEFGIKAAFLYKFLSYVEWWPGTFKEAGAPVVIGVIGAKDVADSLRALTEGRAVGDRPVEVRELQSTDSLNNVHLLFVGHAASSRIPALATVAQQRGTLLVTDSEGALDDGSMINLLVRQSRVRFEVSLDAAEKGGLKLSSRLLGIALAVRPAH